MAPKYLSDLITYNNISGSRTPSLKHFIPNTKVGGRAFKCCAAKLWNNLPLDIKSCDEISLFKKKLKSFLFSKSYENE